MKKKYYIRYYQTYDRKQRFDQFIDAIASTGVRLHTILQREIRGYEQEKELEYTTIWEIDERANYLLLEDRINEALKSDKFNNKK